MKKALLIFLALLSSLSLTACYSAVEEIAQTAYTDTEPITSESTEITVNTTQTSAVNITAEVSNDTKSETSLTQTEIITEAILSESVSDTSDDNISEQTVTSQASTSEATANETAVDIDLSNMSETMAYAQIYLIMDSPLDYQGQTIKVKGTFNAFENTETGGYNYAVTVMDSTACCMEGFEFITEKNLSYPDDFPLDKTQITVTGTFEIYDNRLADYGIYYCRLRDAVIE